MSKFTVILEASKFVTSSGKILYGPICVGLDGYMFPEKSWGDFVAVILDWWISALTEFVTGHSDSVVLRFMDGPFSFTLERIDEELCKVQCLFNDSVSLEKTGVYSINSIIGEVTSAANTVFEYSNKNSIYSADIDALKNKINLMQTNQAR